MRGVSNPPRCLQHGLTLVSPPLVSLDFILAEAHKRGIYVTLVLGDWWTTPGGVNAYVAWSPTATCSEDFFSDPTCIEHYKRNALNLISRTNSISGRRYRDDPTIFAWVRLLVAHQGALHCSLA